MNASDAAITLDGVGKRYWKLAERAILLRSVLPFTRQASRTEMWALKDVNATIMRGETVGIVGRNGAGKTTMLRLLAGVSRPTEGRVRVVGRIAPLISVGVGFHQEMSGRENIFVNGMLLGLSEHQLHQRFDDIVQFAELEDFIDTPVKFYSSGMSVRLGFSVALHSDPEVLLLDEVLAVGDIAFQVKCFDRMREIQGSGTTIVLVSHSVHAISLLCPRTLVMRHGLLDFDGPTDAAIARHLQILSAEAHDSAALDGDHGMAMAIEVVDRKLLGPDGPTNQAFQETPMRLLLRVRFRREIESPLVCFTVVTEDGRAAYQLTSETGRKYRTYAPGDVADVEIRFTPRMAAGTFRLTTIFLTNDHRTILARDDVGELIYLAPRLGSLGMAELGADIHIDGTHVNYQNELTLRAARPIEVDEPER